MRTQPSTRISRWSAAAALVLSAACSDSPVAPAYRTEAALLTAEYECTVDVQAGTTTCRETRGRTGASTNLIVGTPYVTYVTTVTNSRGNAANEDTSTYTVAIHNAIPQPLGTTDGTNLAPGGIRLFFTSGPTVQLVHWGTVSSATIRLETPDGTATFTNQDGSITYTDRMYFQYDEVLAQGDTSAARTMQFIYSSNVKKFTFAYRVSAPAQYEHGWITVAPSTAPVLAPGATTTLTGTVYNQVGVVQADGITWSSSDPAVATVDAAGVVTAVGEGTATITATSMVNAQRTGTRVMTVDAAPHVVSTDPANNATGVLPASDIVVYFSEPVNVSTSSFTLECPTGWSGTFTVSGSGTDTITLNPNSNLPAATLCDLTVVGSQVGDVDANDGPDLMAGTHTSSFQTS